MPDKKEQDAPWRDTPLDHWSTAIDPGIMCGDEWVDNERDPGSQRSQAEELAAGEQTSALRERFMHPEHDVTYNATDRDE